MYGLIICFGFECCLFLAGDSTVVYSLFAVATIVCVGKVLSPYFVSQYFVSLLVLQSSRWRRES